MTITINTFEDIHHLCLMFGLKSTYLKYPFLANNPLAAVPPIHRNPERTGIFGRNKPLKVLYYKKSITIVYDEQKHEAEVMKAFARTLVNEYLALRHPYMKREWDGERLVEPDTVSTIAEII